MKKFLFAASVVILLAGCQSMPPLNFSAPNVGYSEKKIDAELRSATVTIARPDEKTGEIPHDTNVIQPIWAVALQEALNKMAIFRDDAPTKVNLNVKILKVDVPMGGFSMTTETEARYELVNRENGDIIYTQDIASQGTTPLDHAFLGVIRMRESINRSVQNNILQFLQALETVDITKPMFPRTVAAQ